MVEEGQTKTERELVIERLLVSHETWFNVYRDYEYGGRQFAGYAEFHEHGEQYVLVKRAKIWEVDAFEYMFFESAERLDEELLANLVEFMTTKAINKVHPDPNHMTSYLSLVVVTDHMADGMEKVVRKTKFRKNFALGIRGWADLRLAVVDLSTRSVITNSQGKELRSTLEANLAPAREA